MVPPQNLASPLPPEEAAAGQEAPPPIMKDLPLLTEQQRRVKLTVRQQPKQGRQCGFGVKDKRPLDPLPIIQLQVFQHNGQIDEEAMNAPGLLMQAFLKKVDPETQSEQETTLVAQPADSEYPMTRMLEGKLAASAHMARDVDKKQSKACFFIFTDLSVRLEGVFRLVFKLINIGPVSAWAPDVIDEVETEPFTVYSPRRFPGMTESTELAKSLAKQGLQVPIRNDVRKKQ